MVTPEENLKNIIDDIQNNRIMLPDFQRQFDWEISKQIGFVASVLTKLPVGGILLLKANSDDYKSKQIGIKPKEGVSGNIPDVTNFLLDGQQRMTCLTNVFSDVIHDASGYKVSKLAAKGLLANRFYLKLDKWKELMNQETDLFGIRSLDFKFDVSKNEEPHFLTADIKEYVECRPFSAADYGNRPFMPGEKYTEGLDEYCMSGTEDFYLIPLFLLVGLNARDDRLRMQRLLSIIKRIGESIGEAIKTCYRNKETMDEQILFAYTILTEESEKQQFDETNSRDEKEEVFNELVQEKAELWESYFKNYLDSCVQKLKLDKIEMPEGSRERAIDIYENMNRGGLSLSTLDLVAARVAKVSSDSLYERIFNDLKKNNSYLDSAVPADVRSYVPKEYNASTQIKAIDSKVSSICAGLFLEVLGLYCNNPDYDPENVKASYSKSAAILKLAAEEIHENCEKICLALDRTFAFLQLRCGVKTISDVNYKIMMRFIAYIFTNEGFYNSVNIHNKLEAWYWTAIFAGEYDKDQSERFENNLSNMLRSLKNDNYDWLINKVDFIMEIPYFSDCSFILMEKAAEGRIPKEHLGKYICQFYLSRPYVDLIYDEKRVSAFSEKLEKHHIIPIGSVNKIGESTDKLRSDKENIINSPLNYVFITDDTNKVISDDTLEQYENAITDEAKSELSIVNYPKTDDLKNNDKVKAWMKERHKLVKGAIKSRVKKLLGI